MTSSRRAGDRGAQVVAAATRCMPAARQALQLRQMNLLYEMNKERGTTVLIPTEMANSLGTVAGLTRPMAQPPRSSG